MTYPLSSGLQAHVLERATTLAVCWRIVLRDDTERLGTTHDRNITIDSGPWQGTYLAAAGISGSDVRSTADMAVDNMEVQGALALPVVDTSTGGEVSIDVSAADVEAGLFDNADVTMFLVNWRAPNDGQRVMRAGWVGNVVRTAEGAYRTELRGLTQALTQTIGRTLGVGCDAELGDSRCKFNLATVTHTGSVTAIVSERRTFTVSIDGGPLTAGLLVGGKITFNTGLNNGYSKEVRDDDPDIRVFDKFPKDVEVGDEFTVTQGCPKTLAACRDRFSNLVNYRGPMVFAPGDTDIIKVGKK